ncbi:MAG TPA: cupin domain-containing protein [Alphaproteobacteria bacterium]|nr:cupin domain-containing protein [Alphaproteobacteria bacterium]
MSKFHHGTLEEMLKQTVGRNEGWAVAFSHGTLELGLYAPRGEDRQTPHEQDEVYVVMQGQGAFVVGDERHEFGPGDTLFVPAGLAHRFEEFTPDLAAWVVFYGPKGGERG